MVISISLDLMAEGSAAAMANRALGLRDECERVCGLDADHGRPDRLLKLEIAVAEECFDRLGELKRK
jgi:hypothetical protein